MKSQTKKTKTQGKKSKKKGFTLVELLAVIIILAIVVGITIPAVLTTTNGAKSKAFQTAAATLADWIDREYQIQANGLSVVQTLDSSFKANFVDNSYISSTGTVSATQYIFINPALVEAGGLKATNIQTYSTTATLRDAGTTADGLTDGTSNITVYVSNNKSYAKSIIPYSSIYIDSTTGKSCVRLIAKSGGDYDTNVAATKFEVACGGSCGTDTGKGNYCVNGMITCNSATKAKCTYGTS